MDLGIKGKRVFVTGGSRGIGASIAEGFAQEGCKVSLVARHEAELRRKIKELGGERKGHDYLMADLTERGESVRVAKELIARHKCIDIVVHNIGGALGQKDPLAAAGEWNAVWQFNVGIAIDLNAILVPEMKKQKWGRVVHISSIFAAMGDQATDTFGGALAYAASKAYLNAYITGLGRMMAKDNIVITGVMPGAVRVPGKFWDKIMKQDPKQADAFVRKYYPAGRFGKPGEIAPFVVFLASEKVSFASGAIVPVGGGSV